MKNLNKPPFLHKNATIPFGVTLIIFGVLSLFLSYEVRDDRGLLILSLIFLFWGPTFTGLLIIILRFLLKRGIIKGTVSEEQSEKNIIEIKSCSTCNAQNLPDNNFCEQCGSKL